MALLCLCAGLGSAQAQSVFVPPPQYPATPSGMQQYETNQMQVFTPADTSPNYPSAGVEDQPFRWNFLTFRPHVFYTFLYGNGIESSPGQQHNSIVQQLAPGMLIDLGDYWTLDYTPTLTFYSDKNFRNTLDHAVQVNGGFAYRDWVFGLSQGYTSSSDPSVEIGGQTGDQTYNTALNASWQLNSKLSLLLGANQNLNYIGNVNGSTNFASNLTDSRTWSTMDWLDYQFWPRLTGGLGVGVSYINVSAGTDSLNEQYEGQINWRATDKISFQLSGGLEDQQYLNSGSSDLLTPIFNASIQWQPFEQTRLTLAASRTVSQTYFENQTTENTGVSADLNQRLLGKLYLDLSGGYTKTKYVSSASFGEIGFGTGRSDGYYSFNARLTCPFLKRGTLAVFYQYSDNSSTQTGFLQYYQTVFTAENAYAYTSHQIGVQIGYQF